MKSLLVRTISSMVILTKQWIVHSHILPRPVRKRILKRMNRIMMNLGLPQKDGRYLIRDRIVHRPLLINNAGSSSIGKAIYREGLSSPIIDGECMPVWLELAKRSNIILDVGANIGIYGLLACCVNPRIQVWEFEPNPQVFKLLKENVRANDLENDVKCYFGAASNYDGTGSLYLSDADDTASLRQDFRKPIDILEVPVCKLDTFTKERKIDHIDLLKIDAEGTEDRVLEGSKDILKYHFPDIICEVLNGRTEKFLNSFLRQFGYRYYWMTNQGLVAREKIIGDPNYRFLNYLFSSKNQLEISEICAEARSSMSARCVDRTYNVWQE